MPTTAPTTSLSDFLIRYQFLTRRADAKFFDDAGSTWVRIDEFDLCDLPDEMDAEWGQVSYHDAVILLELPGAIIHTDPDGNKSAVVYGSKGDLMAAWEGVAA